MHHKIAKIKKYEHHPLIIKNILTKNQIKKIQDLYRNLPVEINNKRQKIKKKKVDYKLLSKFTKKIY